MNFTNFKQKYETTPVQIYQSTPIKKPIVSICVQAYEHENYISECIESLLIQKTNFEYEILIGEDQSDDKTRDICIDYATRFPQKISLFLHDRQNNISINDMETGRFNVLYNLPSILFSERGEFISFCEGDDFWIDEYKIQKQYDRCILNNIDIVLSNYYYYNNGLISNPYNISKSNINFFKLDIEKIDYQNYHISHISTYFFAKKYMNKLFEHPLLCTSWGLDTLLMPIFFENSDVYYDIDRMSCYRLNSQGLSRQKEDGSGGINKFKYLKFLQLWELHPQYRKFINYKLMINSLKYFCRTGDLKYFSKYIRSLFYFLTRKNFCFIIKENKKLAKTIIKIIFNWLK